MGDRMASHENSDFLENDLDPWGAGRQFKTRMARREEAEKYGLDVDLVVLATEVGDARAKERLLEELEKASDKTAALLKAGSSHPVRRHGHVPQALINDLLVEMLYQCRNHWRPPPILLCRMIARQLDTQMHGLQNVRLPIAWMTAAQIIRDDPKKSSRKVAELVGVNRRTVDRWRKDTNFQKEVESPRGFPPILFRF
jgi:hypothetical protein